ncbi:MAG: putative toxin-antitoxin system toxin component, PIN family [Bacilli bacterium]|nr:putative toxin-antitoxin system toxin component, PIN family [Bacilli bacterium]
MGYYAVIDTNVLVSALLSSKDDAATVRVLGLVFNNFVTPLFSSETYTEYEEVLARPKFKFDPDEIAFVLTAIKEKGVLVNPSRTNVVLPDMKDLPFYEIVMDKRVDGAYLVTGNKKHFTAEQFIVTPAEFMKIIEDDLIKYTS